MSRKSKAEYIGEKRRAYTCASAAKRRQILDEVCETLCYTRKLLHAQIRHQAHDREHPLPRTQGQGQDILRPRARERPEGLGGRRLPLHDLLRRRAAAHRARIRGVHRADKAARGRGRDARNERIDPGPRVQGPAEGEALRRKGQQALRPQQADPRRRRMQVRGGSHGLQRQAGRHADRHGRALRRGHAGELLLDPHADRQADAMDGNHADVEQGHVQHRGGAQAA